MQLELGRSCDHISKGVPLPAPVNGLFIHLLHFKSVHLGVCAHFCLAASRSQISSLFFDMTCQCVTVNAQCSPRCTRTMLWPWKQRTDGVKSGERGKALQRVFLAL